MAKVAEELLASSDASGAQLLGEDGLLTQLTKAVLEQALSVEMTEHLGYKKGDPVGRGSGNSRNHLDEGFDFLGFNVRRYGGKLLIKPSKDAVTRVRKRLHDEMRALRGSNARAVVKKLNPIIKGWATYYRRMVSSRAYVGLDNYMWQLTYKWAKHSHPRKPKTWVVSRYFGRFNSTRRDRRSNQPPPRTRRMPPTTPRRR